MQEKSFNFIAPLLQERSGITLSADKMYLLESRLQPVARQHGHENIDDLMSQLMQRLDDRIMHDIVQVMTTNETMFFRDNKPFERFTQNLLPDLKERFPQRKRIRIWSAASSTGQEAYTMAICLQEQAANYAGYTFEIIGSDLCEKAVKKAQDGVYTQFEVQRGMPIQLLLKYFDQQEGNQWRLKDMIRNMVRFETHNLLNSPSRFGEFDIIFCRNVLIYFNEETKSQVMAHLVGRLREPGYVVLGSAESTIGITNALQPMVGVAGVHMLKN